MSEPKKDKKFIKLPQKVPVEIKYEVKKEIKPKTSPEKAKPEKVSYNYIIEF
ncbi:MAG: hypothetical protein WBK40_10165 [Bacteroidales bacterium]